MRSLLTAILILIAIVIFYAIFVNPEIIPKVVKDIPMPTIGLQKPGPARLHKWQDKDGGWHYTSEPPAEGIRSEIVEYASDVNVLPLPPKLQQQSD